MAAFCSRPIFSDSRSARRSAIRTAYERTRHLRCRRGPDRTPRDLCAHCRRGQPVGGGAAGHEPADGEPAAAGPGAVAGPEAAAALDPSDEAHGRRRALLRQRQGAARELARDAGGHPRREGRCAGAAAHRRAARLRAGPAGGAAQRVSAAACGHVGGMAAARPAAGLYRRGHRLRDPGGRGGGSVGGGGAAGGDSAHRGGRAGAGWRCCRFTATRCSCAGSTAARRSASRSAHA